MEKNQDWKIISFKSAENIVWFLFVYGLSSESHLVSAISRNFFFESPSMP